MFIGMDDEEEEKMHMNIHWMKTSERGRNGVLIEYDINDMILNTIIHTYNHSILFHKHIDY